MPKREHTIDPHLSHTLAQRRRAQRWSQNKLALEAGLTEGLIAKLETCRIPYKPEHRAAIEHALAKAETAATQHPVGAGSAV